MAAACRRSCRTPYLSGAPLRRVALLHVAWATALVVEGGVLSRGPTRPAPPAEAVPTFDSFVQSFGRSYAKGSAEYEARRVVYERRAAEAMRHNSQPMRRWDAGVNSKWDWTDAEFATLLGWSGDVRPEAQAGGSAAAGEGGQFLGMQVPKRSSEQLAPTLPLEKTWSHLETARTIRDQGNCGSCWAIASATVLEYHTEIHSSKRTFSPQQMVACVANPRHCGGQGGCTGATVELAMEWVMQNPERVAQEHQIPYLATQENCTVNETANGSSSASFLGLSPPAKAATSFGMHGWARLPENKYEPLMRAIVERGPVGVSTATTGWGNYMSGVFDGCSPDAIVDHAVVMIGYGQDGSWGHSGAKYWVVQNSWGTDWGEGGFMKMLRRDTDDQECGIDDKPELGSGCKGGPSQVTVCGMCGILYDTVVPYFN